jgi:hypothetical protein
MNKLFSRRRSKVGPQAGLATQPTTTNFFSLPAELRNTIYTLAAQDISLTISRRTSAASLRNIPGILLVSRRCRMEIIPILLSNCKLIACVRDFNFMNVMRVVGGLYSAEMKALRENKNLDIVLDRSEKISERDLRTNLR